MPRCGRRLAPILTAASANIPTSPRSRPKCSVLWACLTGSTRTLYWWGRKRCERTGYAARQQATRKRWPYYIRPLSSSGAGCDVYSRATSCGWPGVASCLYPFQRHETQGAQGVAQGLHGGLHEAGAESFDALVSLFDDGGSVFVEVAEVRGQIVGVGGQRAGREVGAGLGERARVGVDVAQQFPFALL